MKRPLLATAGLTLLGFFALCTVPAALHARTGSRQRRTMEDMRSIATAWEARAADINSYSVGSRHGRQTAERVTTADLAQALEPKYIRKLPRMDGWGTEFQFSTSDYDPDGRAETYVIRSLGSDARLDRSANRASGATSNPADDLIYSNGSFIRYPESSG